MIWTFFTNPSLTLGASRFPLGFPTDFDFQVHAYNEDSLLRNEVVHSPTLTNRSGMDQSGAVNVQSNQEQPGWHDTDI